MLHGHVRVNDDTVERVFEKGEEYKDGTLRRYDAPHAAITISHMRMCQPFAFLTVVTFRSITSDKDEQMLGNARSHQIKMVLHRMTRSCKILGQ